MPGGAPANAEQNIFRKTFDVYRPVFQRIQVFEQAHFVGRAAFLAFDIELCALQSKAQPGEQHHEADHK